VSMPDRDETVAFPRTPSMLCAAFNGLFKASDVFVEPAAEGAGIERPFSSENTCAVGCGFDERGFHSEPWDVHSS